MSFSNNEKMCSFKRSPCHQGTTTTSGQNPSDVLLLGLDFGSTTSSALVARSRILANSITGNMELGDIKIIFRSDISFTPFHDDRIDEAQIAELLKTWFTQSGFKPEDFFAGGVIITGLAARQKNAETLAQLIEQQVGEILVATADDPNLESWLAFMGSCAAMSRYNDTLPIVNLDIGGGTTNPAIGINGHVTNTGCYFIGARHIQFVPGTYQIRALTSEAKSLLAHLNINKQVGDHLNADELDQYLAYYIEALENIARGNSAFFKQNHNKSLEQTSFCYLPTTTPIAITFSGGVGELVYQATAGESLPSTTFYGDLGVDLARAILASELLSRSIKTIIPENRGRATVYGLALHSTEVSGSTLFLPHPEILPLRHLPIVAQLSGDISKEELMNAIKQVCQHPKGASLQILIADSNAYKNNRLEMIRSLGRNFVQIIQELKPPLDLPIVLLVDCNIGKSLGSYATNWNQLAVNLVIIDEVMLKQASFVNISKLHQQVVPVSFYGIK